MKLTVKWPRQSAQSFGTLKLSFSFLMAPIVRIGSVSLACCWTVFSLPGGNARDSKCKGCKIKSWVWSHYCHILPVSGGYVLFKIKDSGLWRWLISSLGWNTHGQEEVANTFMPWMASFTASVCPTLRAEGTSLHNKACPSSWSQGLQHWQRCSPKPFQFYCNNLLPGQWVLYLTYGMQML